MSDVNLMADELPTPSREIDCPLCDGEGFITYAGADTSASFITCQCSMCRGTKKVTREIIQ